MREGGSERGRERGENRKMWERVKETSNRYVTGIEGLIMRLQTLGNPSKCYFLALVTIIVHYLLRLVGLQTAYSLTS